jgi:hypothetical protein
MLQFGRRGRENLIAMTKKTFEVKVQSDGSKYVCFTAYELSKNHPSEEVRRLDSKKRMCETKQPDCPVASFEKYVSKLHPSCDRFWQYPSTRFSASTKFWYCNKPIGKNPMGKMLKKLCGDAELPNAYTNHSLRATTITTLANKGYDRSSIQKVTGHKNGNSLDPYLSYCNDKKRKEMSTVLSNAASGGGDNNENNKKVCTSAPPSTSNLAAVQSQSINVSGNAPAPFLQGAQFFGQVNINYYTCNHTA